MNNFLIRHTTKALYTPSELLLLFGLSLSLLHFYGAFPLVLLSLSSILSADELGRKIIHLGS